MSERTSAGSSEGNARKVAIGVVIALVILVFLYALTDRLTPSTSRGIVSAQVVQIAPRVSGEVVEVHIEDDAVVQAGDPLFSIDPHPFELALRQAEANLKTALQNIDASSASILAAERSWKTHAERRNAHSGWKNGALRPRHRAMPRAQALLKRKRSSKAPKPIWKAPARSSAPRVKTIPPSRPPPPD